MIVCGIDPGKDGAIAGLDLDSREVVFKHVTPTLKSGKSKREYDIVSMADILRSHELGFVMIERQQAFPGQGRSSAFQLGVGYGIWLGLLGALAISHEIVSPRMWTGSLVRGSSGTGKGRNINAAKRLFPTLDLRATERSRKAHDGIADAVLIAEYGARRIRGRE